MIERKHVEAIERIVDRDEQFIDAATTVALRAAIAAALAAADEPEAVPSDYDKARLAWESLDRHPNDDYSREVLRKFFKIVEANAASDGGDKEAGDEQVVRHQAL